MANRNYAFWIADNGDNWLKGVECDPCNPPRLQPEMIMDILTTIRAARDSFNYWFPMLLPAEQERLLGIIQGMPQHVAIDMLIYNERFCMDLQNVRGIHTCGPNGGGEQPLVSNLTPPGTEPAKQG